MEPWLRFIVELAGIMLTSGVFFISINKKLKKAEVKDKEAEVLKKQDDEWQELYREARDRIKTIGEICQELRKENEELKKINGQLELKNQQLTWYRCTINNCPNRRPPHVFDHDGNELESCS